MSSSNVSADACRVVEAFFTAKARHDLAAVVALFADDIVYRFPLPASGQQADWYVCRGRDEVGQYQAKTLDTFSQIRMTDQDVTPSEDGRTVFVEHGQTISPGTSPWRCRRCRSLRALGRRSR